MPGGNPKTWLVNAADRLLGNVSEVSGAPELRIVTLADLEALKHATDKARPVRRSDLDAMTDQEFFAWRASHAGKQYSSKEAVLAAAAAGGRASRGVLKPHKKPRKPKTWRKPRKMEGASDCLSCLKTRGLRRKVDWNDEANRVYGEIAGKRVSFAGCPNCFSEVGPPRYEDEAQPIENGNGDTPPVG